MNITKVFRKKILTVLLKYRSYSQNLPQGCYGWRGATRKNFPPYINVNGVIMGAHRAAWIAEHGKIPDHHFVIHACKNKWCTNPNHLFISRHIKDGPSKSKRVGRKRLGIDLPEELVNDLKIMAKKYNLTMTKYLYRRLTEIIICEKKIDRKD